MFYFFFKKKLVPTHYINFNAQMNFKPLSQWQDKTQIYFLHRDFPNHTLFLFVSLYSMYAVKKNEWKIK